VAVVVGVVVQVGVQEVVVVRMVVAVLGCECVCASALCVAGNTRKMTLYCLHMRKLLDWTSTTDHGEGKFTLEVLWLCIASTGNEYCIAVGPVQVECCSGGRL
jgi:hypothetical protein